MFLHTYSIISPTLLSPAQSYKGIDVVFTRSAFRASILYVILSKTSQKWLCRGLISKPDVQYSTVIKPCKFACRHLRTSTVVNVKITISSSLSNALNQTLTKHNLNYFGIIRKPAIQFRYFKIYMFVFETYKIMSARQNKFLNRHQLQLIQKIRCISKDIIEKLFF